MSYENPHAIGTGVLHSLNYNVGSHGDLSAHYDSLVSADLPLYTGKFYSPTEHEQVSELKYRKIEIGYDEGLRKVTEALDDAPIEAYIPAVVETSDTGSASPTIRPKLIIKDPKKEVIEELINAQREAAGREIIVQDIEIEEIIIRRKIKKKRIKVKNKIHKSD